MIAFSPEQRAAILAEHPEATEADLDRYVDLMSRRLTAGRAPDRGYGAVGATDLEGTRLDGQLAEMQQRLFPRITETLARVAPPGMA